MNTTKHEIVSAKSPDPIIVTRGIVKRVWSDFEPKVVSGLMSGTIAAGAIQILSAYGVHIPTPVLSALPVACMTLAGWMTPSVGTSTIVRTGDGLVVEKHSGNTEIRTGAIPIQQRDATPAPAPAPATTLPSTYDVLRGTSTPAPAPGPIPVPPLPADPEPYETPDSTPEQSFTQVMEPDTSRAGAFLSRLPSSGGSRAAFYEDDTH